MEAAQTDEARITLLASEKATLDSAAALKDLLDRGQKAFSQYDYAHAMQSYRGALVIAQSLADDRQIGISYARVARTLYRTSRFEEALAAFQAGLAASRKAGDQKTQIEGLRGVGNSYSGMGRHREAIAMEEQCLKLTEQMGDKVNEALSLTNLAVDYNGLSESQTALEFYRRALELGEETHTEEVIQTALRGLARIYAEQRDFSLALSYLDQTKPSVGSTLGDQRAEAYRLSQYASIYNRMGGHDADVLKIAGQGMDLAHRTGDLRLEVWFLEVRAETLNRGNRARETVADYEKAVEIFHRLSAVDQEVAGLTRIAGLHLSLHETGPALAAAQRACELARTIDSIRVKSDVLEARGRVYRALGQREAAEADFRESIALMESERANLIGGTTTGQSFFDRRLGPFRELVELRIEAGDLTGAVDAAEEVRARHLLDLISQGKTDITHSLSPEEQQRERELTSEEARWSAALAKPKPAPETRAAFEKAAGNLQLFRANLYLTHPDLRMRRGENKPLSRADLGKLLPDSQTVLIEYMVSEDLDTTVLAIVRGPSGEPSITARKLPIRKPVWEKQVEEFRRALATRDLSYRELAQALYKDLLGPLQPLLAGRSVVGILPDGPLWNLPFQALIGPDGQYLIEHAAVFYAPSLTIMQVVSARPKPTYSPHDTLLAMAGAGEGHDEVRKLGEIYGPAASTVVVGSDATKARWKADAPHYRVLHLATHGILNGANPLFSSLALDEMLEAREILDQDLHAELAVLSACETGRGGVLEGEGVFGLSWSVLMAGVPSVVVSQWKVDAAGTAQLMLAFHRGLARRLAQTGSLKGKAEALRQAFLELLRTPEYRHPFYWAGFEMLGEGY